MKTQMAMPGFQAHRAPLLSIFGLCFLSVLTSFILSFYIDKNTPQVNLPLHIAIKVVCALFAIMTAYFLLKLHARKEGSHFNIQIAGAMFFMGFLNIIYSLQPIGPSHQFILNLTSILGGLLITTILLPTSILRSKFVLEYGRIYWAIILTVLATVCLWLILSNKSISEVEFVNKYQIPLNIVGGCLLLIASVKLLNSFLSLKKTVDLYVSIQCAILALTGIFVTFSTPWQLPWWTFQSLQVIGFAVGLILFNTLLEETNPHQSNLKSRYSKKRSQDSDALLSTLNYHAIISITDRAGIIIEVNDAFCKISGYSREELIGKNPRIINSGVQSAEFWIAMWKDISSGIPWRSEVCNRSKDGNLYWMDTVIAPFIDKEGYVEKYISIHTDITASKIAALQLESALRDSNALQSTLNLHSIISIANRAGNITEVNDAFCRISGYYRDELIGKNHRIINSGIQSPEFWTDMWSTISNGKPWRGEVCNRAKDGSLYWVDTVIAPFVDKNGLIEKYISIHTDISASKRSALNLEHAMRDSNALLSTLNLHAIVSIANRAGFITEVNEAFCKISGYTRHELIGQNHRIINSGTHPPEFWTEMWKTISVGMPWRGQVCNRAKNGSHYWVDTFIAPFIDEFGQIEKYISIRTDITASKMAEEALRWNESLLKMMSNSSPLAFLVVDTRNDKILYFNQRYCSIWGIEHLADNMFSGALKYKDVFQSSLNALTNPTAYLDSCFPLQEETNRIVIEDEIPFKNDRVVRRFSTQIRDSSDDYIGRFYIFEEITESKRVERALKQASEASLAASQAKSQFLANVSHELRTPMNTILGMLALVRKTELTKQQIDYIVKSDSAARSLLGLLNEVLDFSKIEAGKMVLDFHAFSLDQMVLDLSDILSSSIGDKPLVVKFYIAPNMPDNILGDSMRLQQVLINLSSNAIKFTEKGEVVVSIVVVRRNSVEVTLKFSVQDTGIGIAPQNLTNIFKGFVQAESSITRRFGGTGLGLAISQHLVELMGGTIEVESTLGRGSLFHFSISLPILSNIDNTNYKHHPQQAITHHKTFLETAANANPHYADYQPKHIDFSNNNTQRLKGLRILVAEDNLNNQQVIKELLEYDGAFIYIANNGQEAIDAISSAITPFDAVLMDLQMPVMDGFTATTQIRINLGMQDLPIIAMTANAMTSDREACLAAGMNNHIGKPFDINHLINVILKHTSNPEATKHDSSLKKLENSDNIRKILTKSIIDMAKDGNIDFNSALIRMGNKSELYIRTLRSFITDISAMPELFKQQLLAGEFEFLRREFHSLKGSSGTLGINSLMDEASWAESQFTGILTLSTADSVVNHVCKIIASTSLSLTKLLKELQIRQDEIDNEISSTVINKTDKLSTDAMIDILEKMTEKLHNSDMAAIELMEILQEKSETNYAELLAPIDEAINSLNFEIAFQLCNTLIENLRKTKGIKN